MSFSPELEARFEALLRSYPAGRLRSALIPMLLYAQDEVGAVTPEVVAELARRLGIERRDEVGARRASREEALFAGQAARQDY